MPVTVGQGLQPVEYAPSGYPHLEFGREAFVQCEASDEASVGGFERNDDAMQATDVPLARGMHFDLAEDAAERNVLRAVDLGIAEQQHAFVDPEGLQPISFRRADRRGEVQASARMNIGEE